MLQIIHLSPTAIRRGAPWAVLAGVLFVGACATPPVKPVGKYVAPATGPTAKFVMRGVVPAGDYYGVFVLEDTERCGSHRIVGAGDTQRHPTSTSLAANQIQTVEFRLFKPNKQFCSIRWSFTPAAGKTYLLRGLGQPAGCVAVVMDMTDPDKLKLEPTALRRNPGGSTCLPLAQSKGSTSAGADAGQGQEAVLRQGAGADDLQGLIGK